MIWPNYRDTFAPNFPDLLRNLTARGAGIVDIGGFVPGGLQDFDSHDYPAATVAKNTLTSAGLVYGGYDVGEQDARFLMGYAKNAALLGPLLDPVAGKAAQAAQAGTQADQYVGGVHYWYYMHVLP